ncbi:MAG: peroxidase [Planctomycetota bacterium]|nr:peroxidase [Planctomycetota bacterium]
MFLKDLLAANRGGETGRFGRVIEASRRQGVEPPGIYYLFAARPEATPHLCNFMEEVMRGTSELSAGQRELIAAFVSARNGCKF